MALISLSGNNLLVDAGGDSYTIFIKNSRLPVFDILHVLTIFGKCCLCMCVTNITQVLLHTILWNFIFCYIQNYICIYWILVKNCLKNGAVILIFLRSFRTARFLLLLCKFVQNFTCKMRIIWNNIDKIYKY